VHISTTERRADLATRDASDWLKCEFMLDKVGNTYSGKISSVTAFGLFILLDEIFVEGLVHISDLQSDYYHYDEKRHELKGERSKTVFCLADAVSVQVASVNLDDKKIEFLLMSDGEQNLTDSKVGAGKSGRLSKAATQKKRKPKSSSSTQGKASLLGQSTSRKKFADKKKSKKPS
jgi:ribonuclease R